MMTATPTVPDAYAQQPAPMSLEASGLRIDLIVQLLAKTLHFAGELSGIELADRLGLTFPVIEPGIERLKTQRLCEIVGGTSLGAPSYRYRITQLGREHAGSYLDRNMYTGIAPVTLDHYRRYMFDFQARHPGRRSRDDVKKAFSHLVLSEKVLDQLGPAINANHSLFVYGPPGNGKTVVAMAIRNLLLDDFWIPHAIDVDGSLIQVFDPVNHEPLPIPTASAALDPSDRYDRRWVRCKRPAVMVGGELTLEHLELTYNQAAGFYRAPVQLLANGGVLVIDDFGRQSVPPQALLNRWITPLESRIDFLTLQSGQKVEIPFMTLPVFATNIKPVELVDEAFLRRIQYKVFAQNPTIADFHQIFERVCRDHGLTYDRGLVDWLTNRITERKIALRACHPRDLVNQALALAQYRGDGPMLTPELLDAACETYFVDEDQGIERMN